jgi:hypothetical protein
LPKKIFQEVPLDRIIGFPEIQFQQAVRRRTLPAILPEKLLNKVDVITHKLATQEGVLHGADNVC